MKIKSLEISICSIIIALSTITMMLTGLITIGTYTFPAIASVFISIVVIEINKKFAVGTYIVTALLSLLLVVDKEAVFLYVLFLGYYPILKSIFERIQNNFVLWLLKFFIFNISVFVLYFVVSKFLMLSDDSFYIFGVSLPLLFLLVGNVIFFLYDYTLSLLIKTYILKLHPKLNKIIKNTK